MKLVSLKEEIHKYIDEADDRFISLVYAMIKADQSENEYELSQDEINLLEERLADYKKNPEAGDSWEVVSERLRKKSK